MSHGRHGYLFLRKLSRTERRSLLCWNGWPIHSVRRQPLLIQKSRNCVLLTTGGKESCSSELDPDPRKGFDGWRNVTNPVHFAEVRPRCRHGCRHGQRAHASLYSASDQPRSCADRQSDSFQEADALAAPTRPHSAYCRRCCSRRHAFARRRPQYSLRSQLDERHRSDDFVE